MPIEKSEDTEKNKDETAENSSSEASKTEEQPMTMLPSEFAALVDKKIADAAVGGGNADLIAALEKVANGNEKYEKYDEMSYMSPANIDKEDMLDDPVVFWAQGYGYVIGDDKKKGIPIPPPYKIIHFTPEGSKATQSGKDTNILIWSKYQSWSKKEVEFLENHTLFGFRFFKRSDETASIDVRYAQFIARYVGSMKTMEAHRVVEQARTLKVVVSDDLDTMKIAIAQILATQAMERQEEGEKIRLKETGKAALISG